MPGPRAVALALFKTDGLDRDGQHRIRREAHAQHFRTLAIDMIGHGFTDKPDTPYTIPVYVKHLLDFMDAVGIKRAHLSGESLGGWIAAWFARTCP